MEPSRTVLIRHDKRPETPPHPRGGFLVGESVLPEVMEYFFDLGRIVAVYEKADPFQNGHNFNVLFESPEKIWIEVVGPGFDAGDLQRGDITPHEIFSITLSAEGTISGMSLIRRVDQNEYAASVQSRRRKMIEKLKSSPTPEIARRIREELRIPDDVENYISTLDSPINRLDHYPRISRDLLKNTVNQIVQSSIIEQFIQLTGSGYPLNFSSSLVNNGAKQIFWDIVSPALKFEGLKANLTPS